MSELRRKFDEDFRRCWVWSPGVSLVGPTKDPLNRSLYGFPDVTEPADRATRLSGGMRFTVDGRESDPNRVDQIVREPVAST